MRPLDSPRLTVGGVPAKLRALGQHGQAALRIATFNLESLDEGPGVAPALEARLPILAPMLERLAADVICFQEVNAQPREGGKGRDFAALGRLLAAAGLSGYAVVHSEKRGAGPADHHNLATASHVPIEETHQLWHDLVPAPRHGYVTAGPALGADASLAWERPVLYTRLRAPGGETLHLYNVHLRAPLACPVPGQKEGAFAWKSIAGWAEGYYLSEIKRAGQAFELRLALDRLFDAEPSAHVCIAGDFNAEEHHAPIEILRGEEDNTGNPALAARVMVPVERAVPASSRYSVIHQGRRQMLDHVMASRALMGHLRGCEIHNEALSDEVTAYGRPSSLSYHAPVVAVFDL